MTKDEALKMAKEFIKEVMNDEAEMFGVNDQEFVKKPYLEMIGAIDKALEQPAQEPVEVYAILDDGNYVSVEATEEDAIKHCAFMNKHDCNCNYRKLYTHPYQWQELTDDEINKLILNGGHLDCVLDYESSVDEINVLEHELLRIARAIEQVLKEKNTS
jgi:hypothetical protein